MSLWLTPLLHHSCEAGSGLTIATFDPIPHRPTTHTRPRLDMIGTTDTYHPRRRPSLQAEPSCRIVPSTMQHGHFHPPCSPYLLPRFQDRGCVREPFPSGYRNQVSILQHLRVAKRRREGALVRHSLDDGGSAKVYHVPRGRRPRRFDALYYNVSTSGSKRIMTKRMLYGHSPQAGPSRHDMCH